MLKVQPPVGLQLKSEFKCGEIFCHNFTDVTIHCNFCNMKLFAMEDFLLHLRNLHLEKSPLTADALTEEYIKIESVETEDIDKWLNSFPETDALEQKENKNFTWPDDCVEECSKILKTNSEITSKEDQINKETYESDENECYKIIKTDIEIVSKEDEINTEIESNEDDDSTEFTFVAKRNHKTSKKSNKKSKKIKSTSNKFPCPECQEIFTLMKDLDSHVVDVHKGHKCSQCDTRFRHRHHLQRHSLIHDNLKRYSCPECGRLFTNPEYCKRHFETHSLERPYVCEFENCGKAYVTKLRLRLHSTVHTNKQLSTNSRNKPKNIVCDMCGYTCASIKTLEVHQRTHTGEKPFICEICSKNFVSKTSLRLHLTSSHSSKREHVCNICQATFARKQILKNHMSLHTDGRNFKCKYCDKTYKQENVLRNHIVYVHKKTKPWPRKKKPETKL